MVLHVKPVPPGSAAVGGIAPTAGAVIVNAAFVMLAFAVEGKVLVRVTELPDPVTVAAVPFIVAVYPAGNAYPVIAVSVTVAV